MKKLIRNVMLFGGMCLLSTSLYAKAPNKLFPTYTGIAATLIHNDQSVRTYPDEYAEVLCEINSQEVHVVGQNEAWYKIVFNDQEGWVYKEAIQITEPEYVPYSKILGEEIVDYGKQFIGTPYVWGGNDLKSGVDCSGLTKEVYETFDIGISRLAALQAGDGRRIQKAELMPGDLVFFDTTGTNNGQISHVGIYAGSNQFLHADCTHGVMISSLDSPYYARNYVTSSRIIGS